MESAADGSHVDYPSVVAAGYAALPPVVARRYRAIFAQTAEGLFLFEAVSKRIVEANPAFLRLLGYRPADLSNLTLYDLIAHDRASINANIAQIVREGHNAIGERDYRRKDGSLVPVEVGATALTEAGCAILCVVVRDLTAHKEAADQRAADEARLRASEARLRESEGHLRETVDNAPILLFAVDRAGIVTFARGRALATLGLTPSKVQGRSAFVLTAGRSDLRANLHRALAGEEFTVAVTLLRLGAYSRGSPAAPYD